MDDSPLMGVLNRIAEPEDHAPEAGRSRFARHPKLTSSTSYKDWSVIHWVHMLGKEQAIND